MDRKRQVAEAAKCLRGGEIEFGLVVNGVTAHSRAWENRPRIDGAWLTRQRARHHPFRLGYPGLPIMLLAAAWHQAVLALAGSGRAAAAAGDLRGRPRG